MASSGLSVSRGVWSTAEHERFLEAIAWYPAGPWHLITAHVGTRSAKQVQTHAQKYQHKLLRHQRGLRKWKTTSKRQEHRVDAATIDCLLRLAGRKNERVQFEARPLQSHKHEAFGMAWEDTGSESSDWSDGSAALDAIEPISFRSSTISSLTEQERTDVCEALDETLSYLTAVKPMLDVEMTVVNEPGDWAVWQQHEKVADALFQWLETTQ